MSPSELRAPVTRSKRVIVKIGSRTVASDRRIYERLAKTIAERRSHSTFVVVTSGAIALGVKKLGYGTRPKEMSKLQAAAAAGQSVLMRAYEEAFAENGLAVAQVLLTHADLADRTRGNNARAALGALLDAGAVPILNENDSVAVDEIRFGDNDQLASMVVPLVDADLVVLLSDVEGLLDANGKRIAIVRDARDALAHVRTSGKSVGTGGMSSKVEAARRATLAGANVVVADGAVPGILDSILAGEDVGTLFVAARERLNAKKYWIAFTLRPRGDLVLDAGAVRAVSAKGKSVLSVGVLGVRGDFRAGDAVRLLDGSGLELGRGLARCGAADAARVSGKAREELPAELLELGLLVHADELVVGGHS